MLFRSEIRTDEKFLGDKNMPISTYTKIRLTMLSLSGFELYSRCLPPIFDRKPTIRNKIHKRESKLLKQNNKEEKVILPFVTEYQPSMSTIKEA